MTGLRRVPGTSSRRPAALHVLNLAYGPSDAELIQACLAKGDINCEMVRVQTGDDFVAALEDGGIDLIIADYAGSPLDGLSALEAAREIRPEVPFIMISDTVDEDLAIKIMKNGATDYVLRHSLERLVPAVRRAMNEAEERRERERAEEALRRSEEKYRALVEQIPATTYTQQIAEPGSSRTSPTLYASPQIESQTGYPPQSFLEDPELWIRILHPEDRERVLAEDRRTDETGEPFRMEYRQTTRDGRTVWIRDEAMLVRDEEGLPRFWQGVMYDITEHKATEEELARLASYPTLTPDPIVETNAAGRTTYLNPAAQRLFPDLPVLGPRHPALRDLRSIERQIRKSGGRPAVRETEVGERVFQQTVRPVPGSDLLRIYAVDVTERRRAEDALRESEERFRLLAERTNDLICLHEPDGRCLYVSPSCRRLLGYEPRELLGKDLNQLIHPADAERIRHGAQTKALEEQEARPVTYRIRKKSGEYAWFETLMEEILDEAGEVVQLQTSSRDVSERKHVEETLRQSEQLFRAIFEQAAVGTVYVGLDGRWLKFNDKFCEILGYTREELPTVDFRDILMPEDLERDLKRGAQMLAGDYRDYSEEKLIRRKDGSWAWINITVSLVYSPTGPEHFVAVIENITERRQAEEALTRSEILYRTVVEQAAENIFVVDLESMRILEANAALQRSLGYGAEELTDMSLYDIVAHDKESIDENTKRVVAEGHYFIGERSYRRKDGTLVDVEVSVSTVPYEGRDAMAIVAHDITERKRAEESLRHSLSVLLALREAGQVLGSTLSSEEIVSRLLEIMRGVSHLTAVVLSVEDEGELRIWRSAGLERLRRRARFEQEAEAARRATLEYEEHRTFRLRSSGPEDGTLIGLCLPLRIKKRVVGVLEAYGEESLAGTDALEILSSLSSQAASALENAWLYEELGERERALQNLVEKLLGAQEEERRRVAYEVHDGLAQVAVAAHQNLQAFARRHPPGTQRGQKELEQILEQVRATVSDARRIIANLRPTVLDDLGLAAAVSLEVEYLRENGYQVDYEENLRDQRPPDSVEIALFRIVQEALTNVRKHAQTRRVRVRLGRTDNEVYFEVQDYGRGFDPVQASAGSGPGERVGLAGMRERVSMLGGELEIRSQPGVGTSLVVSVPVA